MNSVVVHLVLLVTMPPLLLGIINRTKAWFAGRKGPPVLQPYYDIFKLMQKKMVVSTTTTWIFRVGPVVTLVTLFCAGLLVPMGRFNSPLSFTGDFILFAYVFGLARFFTTAAALDTGSAFEGMGASREVTFACFSEPALFFAFLVLVKLSGSLSLTTMLHLPVNDMPPLITASVVLITIGLFIVLLAECCRIPVDDPNTHLELTMIHEVMVLDHSGPLFGVITYAAALKLLILGTVLIDIVTQGILMRTWTGWLLFACAQVLLSILVGIIESVMARLQMRNVPYLLISALLFCAFGFILLIR